MAGILDTKTGKIVGRFVYARKPGIAFTQPSKAVQSEKNNVDINTIVKRYKKTGLLPVLDRKQLYGDFSNSEDFLTLQNKIANVRSDFERLPSAMRERFSNDPGQLIDFLADPANVKEAVEMKLLPVSALPKEEPAPVEPAPVVEGQPK